MRPIAASLLAIVGAIAMAVLFTAAARAADEDDHVDAAAVREIIDDCVREPAARRPGPIAVIPLIGGAIDRAVDGATDGPARRVEAAADRTVECIDAALESRRGENEREAERARRDALAACAANQCSSPDWRQWCQAYLPPDAPEIACTTRRQTQPAYTPRRFGAAKPADDLHQYRCTDKSGDPC